MILSILVDGQLIAPAILGGVLAAACIYGALQLMQGGHDFIVIADQRGVRFRGRFPAGYQRAVANFLGDYHAQTGQRVKVIGSWNAQGRLHLAVRGPSGPQNQQIRNFLMMTLRP